jgi:hypothetical protein
MAGFPKIRTSLFARRPALNLQRSNGDVMDKDKLNKERFDRMRLARARLGLDNLDNGEIKKELTPLQADLEFFLQHQISHQQEV